MSVVAADLESRVRTVRHFPPMRLDGDGLERFFARAAAFVPPGDVVASVDVRDGNRSASFHEIDALFRAPHLPDSLDDVVISLVRSAAGIVTHEIRLEAVDGRATLSALGDELWSYGTSAALSDILDVYAVKVAAKRPLPLVPLNYFSAGFVLATSFAAGMLRGSTRGAAAFGILAIVWFSIDMALSEVRSALTPPAGPPFVIELRAPLAAARTAAKPERLWTGIRFGVIVLWFAVATLVFTLVLRHVPAKW